jgi:2-keto-3-deoxy-L-rhamnonate aldolase RhmA
MEFYVPGLAQMARAVGAEFIVYDMEHSGAGLDAIKAQCAACRGIGVAPIVRVAAARYDLVAGALDVGAHGVMVPMVENAVQAREIVSWTRYPPAGKRGAAFGVAHDDYLPGLPAVKMAAAMERTLVLPILESPAGIEAAPEIAAEPGVDVLWLGSFDLTSFMGIPAQFDHPRYKAAEARMLDATRAHGKTAGFVAADGASARDCRARGYGMLAVGIDFQLYQRALAEGIAALRQPA